MIKWHHLYRFLSILMALLAASILIAQTPQRITLPEAAGKTLDGTQRKLSDYSKRKGLLILFVSTQCPVSNAYNGRLLRLSEEAASGMIGFLAVYSNITESTNEIMLHAQEKKFQFPILIDQKGDIARRLGATVTPEAFLFDASLRLVYQGRIDDNQREERVSQRDLDEAIGAILAGTQPMIQVTPAKGCILRLADEK